MSSNHSRREMLAMGLGAAGLLMTRNLHLAAAPAKGFYLPDRSKDAPALPVSIQRCESYEPKLVRERLDAAFAQTGGVKDLVNGKTVSIKINVTGGPGKLAGLPGYRTYQLHPNVLAAMCAIFHDAGAKRIIVLESQYSPKSPEEVLTQCGWDVKMIQAAGGHTVSFEDTRNKGKWPTYSKLTVPWGGYLFPAFLVNQSYEKTDVMVSLAKLKDHSSAGVTMAVKNLFGMPPTSLYANDAPNENTTSYRGDILHNAKRGVPAGVPADDVAKLPQNNWKYRVPRITADLLGARPIDLSVVDGIETNRGGEGPWNKGVEPLAPKLLLVGRNAVCTDAISTAAMGYNPQANHFEWPFMCENHLLLLAQAGVGSIDPQRIEVRGLELEKAIFPFNPKKVPLDLPTAYSRPYLHTAHA